ncbi:MAG: sigma factor-like helix-turn-helix DNA-binding protein [Candidatus Aenigmatarchaeota archaeon]|nr:hypothetical protein [Candidatus Aenigmarchaeota archaeon]
MDITHPELPNDATEAQLWRLFRPSKRVREYTSGPLDQDIIDELTRYAESLFKLEFISQPGYGYIKLLHDIFSDIFSKKGRIPFFNFPPSVSNAVREYVIKNRPTPPLTEYISRMLGYLNSKWSSEHYWLFFEGELYKLLDECLETVPYRERRILQMRFGLGDDYPRSLRETAQEFGVSSTRIWLIQKRALNRLRREFVPKLEDYLMGQRLKMIEMDGLPDDPEILADLYRIMEKKVAHLEREKQKLEGRIAAFEEREAKTFGVSLDVLRTPISELDLPKRVKTSLREYERVSDLPLEDLKSLLYIRGFGEKALEALKNELRRLGLNIP